MDRRRQQLLGGLEMTRRVSVASVFTMLQVVVSVFTTRECLELQVVVSVFTMMQVVASALKLRVLEVELAM